jgi:hypothetical protein
MIICLKMFCFIQDLDMVAVIDLHTAPGSQNGFDNSGRTGDPHWVEWGQVSCQYCTKMIMEGVFLMTGLY